MHLKLSLPDCSIVGKPDHHDSYVLDRSYVLEHSYVLAHSPPEVSF